MELIDLVGNEILDQRKVGQAVLPNKPSLLNLLLWFHVPNASQLKVSFERMLAGIEASLLQRQIIQ